jgi:hypothetical protein
MDIVHGHLNIFNNIFVAPSDYDKKLLFLHGLKAADRFSSCCGGISEVFQPIK